MKTEPKKCLSQKPKDPLFKRLYINNNNKWFWHSTCIRSQLYKWLKIVFFLNRVFMIFKKLRLALLKDLPFKIAMALWFLTFEKMCTGRNIFTKWHQRSSSSILFSSWQDDHVKGPFQLVLSIKIEPWLRVFLDLFHRLRRKYKCITLWVISYWKNNLNNILCRKKILCTFISQFLLLLFLKHLQNSHLPNRFYTFPIQQQESRYCHPWK